MNIIVKNGHILLKILRNKDNFTEQWKDYFLKNGGNPLQKEIYDIFSKELAEDLKNRVLTGMTKEEAEAYNQKTDVPESIEQLIEVKMAQIYAYQVMLNKRIGQFFYNLGYLDRSLMRFARNELLLRESWYGEYAWVVKKYFEKHIHDYRERAFDRFKATEEYELLQDSHPKPVLCKPGTIFKKYKKEKAVNRFDGSYEKRDQITCLISSFGEVGYVLVGSSNTRKFPKLSKFPEGIDNKDILYILAITFVMDTSDFENLKQIAVESCRNTSKFAENMYDNRDSMIIAIVRNVKDWYWQAIHEISAELWESEKAGELTRAEQSLTGKRLETRIEEIEKDYGSGGERSMNVFRKELYANALKDLNWKKKVILGVLMRVDKIIDENGFCQENFDKLLLHNFFLNYKAYCPGIDEKKEYDKVFAKYREWKDKSDSESRIFEDFYRNIHVWAKDIDPVKQHG